MVNECTPLEHRILCGKKPQWQVPPTVEAAYSDCCNNQALARHSSASLHSVWKPHTPITWQRKWQCKGNESRSILSPGTPGCPISSPHPLPNSPVANLLSEGLQRGLPPSWGVWHRLFSWLSSTAQTQSTIFIFLIVWCLSLIHI